MGTNQEITSNLSNPLNMCLRSGTALPTYRYQVQLCTSIIFLLLSVGKSADANHTMCTNYLLSILSLSLCSRYAIPNEMVVDKQCRVREYSTILCCTCEDLAAEERILISLERLDHPEQKNGCSFEKKGSASAHINSSHSRDIVANVHYVVALPNGKIYLQLV